MPRWHVSPSWPTTGPTAHSKAQLLPSVNLSGGLGNFNRSLVQTRNYEDGRLAYVTNNTMSNNLTLSIDQQIAATGGTISLQSYLYSRCA